MDSNERQVFKLINKASDFFRHKNVNRTQLKFYIFFNSLGGGAGVKTTWNIKLWSVTMLYWVQQTTLWSA